MPCREKQVKNPLETIKKGGLKHEYEYEKKSS